METVSLQRFGDLLRRYRLAAGLTQEELAEQAAMSVRGLIDPEQGARRAPHRETIQMLAQALHLSEKEQTRLESAARKPDFSPVHASGGSISSPPHSAPPYPFVGRAQELALLEQVLAGA